MLFSITTQQNTDHFLRVNQRYESFLKDGLQIRYNCAPVGCPAPTHNPKLQGRNDRQEGKRTIKTKNLPTNRAPSPSLLKKSLKISMMTEVKIVDWYSRRWNQTWNWLNHCLNRNRGENRQNRY